MSLFGNGERCHREPIELEFHQYRYFTYEKELARREAGRISGLSKLISTSTGFQVFGDVAINRLRSLAYVAKVRNGSHTLTTSQHQLEESYRQVSGMRKRQATRYSVHGLHEYKGRFNPQLARFLLNYLGATENSKILDPFCGSGTTLVEATLQGMAAVGVDSNPLAVFISNAKLRALTLNVNDIEESLYTIVKCIEKGRRGTVRVEDDSRIEYLRKWFPNDTLGDLEMLRLTVARHAKEAAPVVLALTSDLLREYSLQEPSDLRIRRRTSAMPSLPLIEALVRRATVFCRRLRAAQQVTGLVRHVSRAMLSDSRHLDRMASNGVAAQPYDCVITSPPYATALPYIDTNRLSLVWLGLIPAAAIREFEADAIGSREIRRQGEQWNSRIEENSDKLPDQVVKLCRQLAMAIGDADGFRRKAVPSLIYRYFADMQQVFRTMSRVLKRPARLAFVVGPNHTTLGGKRFDINTPEALATIASAVGFYALEVLPLETYQRYGMHQKNSIQKESLTVLELK